MPRQYTPVKTPIEVHPCQECGKIIPKRKTDSRNRYFSRKYCSTICAKKYMKDHQQGWFSYNSMRIRKDKSKEDDLPPLLWTEREVKEYFEKYPELSNF